MPVPGWRRTVTTLDGRQATYPRANTCPHQVPLHGDRPGSSTDNAAIAAAAAKTAADVVALSTYNGMAASLTKDLLRET